MSMQQDTGCVQAAVPFVTGSAPQPGKVVPRWSKVTVPPIGPTSPVSVAVYVTLAGSVGLADEEMVSAAGRCLACPEVAATRSEDVSTASKSEPLSTSS